MNIIIAECKQEVSTFNPTPSSYSDFVITHGEELLQFHRTARNEIGGALSVFEAQTNFVLWPTYSARAITSGGPLGSSSWAQISREFLSSLKNAPAVDGVYFSMHGAMSAQNEDDPEGYLLQEARIILGEKVPIIVSLDLHGILTTRMLQHSTATVTYHTYPHIDFFETGKRAARLLLKILEDQIRPVTAVVKVPVLARGDEMITETGLVQHIIRAAQKVETGPGGLSAGMFWGNPFTDVPDLGSYSLVVTDGNAGLAEREALHMARMFWEHHKSMQVSLTSINDAVQIAHSIAVGTVILVDAADAPSSGASGDSNSILRALTESHFQGRALIPIVDAAAVKVAFGAGIGETIAVTLGGSKDPARFEPLSVSAKVRMLSDGRFRSEHQREVWNGGNSAVFEIGSIVVVATSSPVSLFDRSLFYAHGQDPREFNVVIVKSPHCEAHMFKQWAVRYIDVDAPGSTSANVAGLGHNKCARPMFPIDHQFTFEPKAIIYQQKF